MGFSQLLIFVSIIFIVFLKAISIKPCSKKLPFDIISLYMGFLTTLFCIVSFPFFKDKFISDFNIYNIAILFCVIKGFLLAYHFRISQELSKETASSRTMVGLVALGFIAFINMNFFGEILSNKQIIVCSLIFIIGILFYFKGHINKTTKRSHFCFLLLITTSVILSVLDHVVLGYIGINWYTYLFISSFIMFLFGLKNKKKMDIKVKEIITNKILNIAVGIAVFSEIFLMYIRVTYIPVSQVQIATIMSVPFIMVYMSLKWNEGKIKNQAIFGVISSMVAICYFY